MPPRGFLIAPCQALCLLLTVTLSAAATEPTAQDPEIQGLVAAGNYALAEELLRHQIRDLDAPATRGAAVELEILRRTRQDFPLTDPEVLAQIQKTAPDVTPEDLERWRASGDLQHRVIDGQVRYFREAAPNLFRANAEARSRQTNPPAKSEFDMPALIHKLLPLAAASQGPEVYPVRQRVTYELAVKVGHPRVKPGAKVRAWLPFPQEYRQQRDVQLISSEPAHASIAPAGTPQRTIYFEQVVADPPFRPRFDVKFEFTTSAYVPQLDAARAQPYRTDDALYREFTAERPPHIVFTPEVRQVAGEAVGDATNPLERAQRVFRWVANNVTWCSEMEYSTIRNISAKGLSARRGDCGVQGFTFITLCRAVGVPARWQSGWQTKPGHENMHDWSEFYVEPWGWLPADASSGAALKDNADPQVRDFFCGRMDPYRLIVNLDYARELVPPKTSFRSEPNDFQRGEIEIDGHNLYFDEWDWEFQVKTTPLSQGK